MVDDWKYIEPSKFNIENKDTHTELGNSTLPQLYNLKADMGETKNLADEFPQKVDQLRSLLSKIKAK